jgi:hypothetical protein
MEAKERSEQYQRRKALWTRVAVLSGTAIAGLALPVLALAGVGDAGTTATQVASQFTAGEMLANGAAFLGGSGLAIYGVHGIHRKMGPQGSQHNWGTVAGSALAGGALISIPIFDGMASNTLFGNGSVATSGNRTTGTSIIP